MKYSVIIPVYNKANTIVESIESVLAQSEKDFELIIVNDGSTDNIEEVLKVYKDIRLINQKNGGVSVARNTGINNAKGNYICFLDADDIWLPNHLEEFNKLIMDFPSAKLFATSHIETTDDGIETHSSDNIKDYPERFVVFNLFELLNTHAYGIINTNSVCINKDIFLKHNIYFEPGEKIGEDTDVWYRIGLISEVAISKIETNIYRREHSTATKEGNQNFDWVFARRYSEIENNNYDFERVLECGKMIDRYKLSCCRDYMLLKNRKKAKELLKTVKYHEKRYYGTLLIVNLPYFLGIWLIKRIL